MRSESHLREQMAREVWRLRLDHYAARVSRGAWVRYSWAVWLCRIIQDEVMRGNARIVINAPPRHGKSEILCHWLPTWYLDWFPERRVMLAAYEAKFATEWGRKVRDELMNNDLVISSVRKDVSAAGNWQTPQGGGMLCGGIKSGFTGRGGDLQLIDDPHKNWEEAMSPAYRKRVIDFYRNTYSNRGEPNASVILLMTRWSEDDLSGYLTGTDEDSDGEKWLHIRLPAIAEDDDLLGRAKGEALCPERYDLEKLIGKDGKGGRKRTAGSRGWAGIFQQRPRPDAGVIFQKPWLRFYDELPEKLDLSWFSLIVQSWDMSFKDEKMASTEPDFVCGQIWGLKGEDRYLLDLVRGKWDLVDTIKQMGRLSKKWPAATTRWVEDAANGPAIASSLKRSRMKVILVDPKGSKTARAFATEPIWESGNVLLPRKDLVGWVEDFIEELLGFPNAKYDDQVDAMTQALIRLRPRRRGKGKDSLPPPIDTLLESAYREGF